MTPAQLARLNAARRLPNSTTVQIVLDDYAALIPTLRLADSVPGLQAEIAHLRSALAAQVDATAAEAGKLAEAKARWETVRRSMMGANARAEMKAQRLETALAEAKKADPTEYCDRQAEFARLHGEIARLKERYDSLVASKGVEVQTLLAALEVERAAALTRRPRADYKITPRATCTIPGCHELESCKKLCIRHYEAKWRKGRGIPCCDCGCKRNTMTAGRCRPCYFKTVRGHGKESAKREHV
jgi:hypothetical protein